MPVLVLPHALDARVESLKSIGKANAERLDKLGVKTVRDLLLTLPFAQDAFMDTKISALVPDTLASITGTVLSIKPIVTQRRHMRLVEAIVADDSGAQLRAVWFNSRFVLKYPTKRARGDLAGPAEKDTSRGGVRTT